MINSKTVDYDIFKSSEKPRFLMRNDVVEFECSRCGKCCKTVEYINLSPYDLYCISNYIGMPAIEMLNRYFTMDFKDTILPTAGIINDDGVCVFYSGGKCSIYDARPFVCRLFPLGYFYNSFSRKADYFPKAGNICLGSGRSIKLKTWLRQHHAHTDSMWQWFLDSCDIHDMIAELNDVPERHGLLELVNGLMGLLLNYDDSDYYEQYRRNKDNVIGLISRLKLEK